MLHSWKTYPIPGIPSIFRFPFDFIKIQNRKFLLQSRILIPRFYGLFFSLLDSHFSGNGIKSRWRQNPSKNSRIQLENKKETSPMTAGSRSRVFDLRKSEFRVLLRFLENVLPGNKKTGEALFFSPENIQKKSETERELTNSGGQKALVIIFCRGSRCRTGCQVQNPVQNRCPSQNRVQNQCPSQNCCH